MQPSLTLKENLLLLSIIAFIIYTILLTLVYFKSRTELYDTIHRTNLGVEFTNADWKLSMELDECQKNSKELEQNKKILELIQELKTAL